MTVIPQTCLSTDELRDYILGRTPDDRFEVIASHLEICLACEDTMSSLDDTADSMLDHLRLPPAQRIARTPEYAAAIERLQSGSFGITPSSASDIGPANQFDANHPVAIRDYQLIALLGTGGMGTVYKAIHTRLGRIVALKMLPMRRIRDADAIARFEREMKAIGKLDHPAIVSATDAGEVDGQHFLAMEFVEGLDVSQLVDRHGPLSIPDACEIIRQAAAGLQHIHERGLVHRDIKPSNLMITADGNVKILDLGLALLAEQHESIDELTTVGQMMGTVDYMAPEQCDDCHDIDIRADIYSLGATLFKMLTGRAPFATSDRRSPLSRIRALATEQPPRLGDCLKDLPPDFCAVFDRILARNLNDRYSAPGKVAEAISPFTTDHHLKGVMEKASAASAPAVNSPVPSLPPKSLLWLNVPTTVNSGVKTPTKYRVLKYLVPLIVFAAMAIVLRLQTDKGELIVECNVPNVQIRLLKDGKIHDELKLKQGRTSISVFSGQYEIKILEESDSVEITADRFKISRGSTVVAEVRYARHDSDKDRSTASTESEKSPPIYSGKTFAQWKKDLADRDPAHLCPALKAIGVLGATEDPQSAGRLIFESVGHLFQTATDLSPSRTPTDLDQIRSAAVESFRPLLVAPEGIALLGELLVKGDKASRRFAISVLDCREANPPYLASGYNFALNAIKNLVPALVTASHDADVDLRIATMQLTQGNADTNPDVGIRWTEMVASDDFRQLYAMSEMLFEVAPDKRQLIGDRFLQFYEANRQAISASRVRRDTSVPIGDTAFEPISLLHIAIECGIRSEKISEELMAAVKDTKAARDLRGGAAFLLGIQSNPTGKEVGTLLEILEGGDSGLTEKCSTTRYCFQQRPGVSKYHGGESLRLIIIEALGNAGPAAVNAIPWLIGFISVEVDPADLTAPKSFLSVELRFAIEALGKIGMNAQSVQAVEKYLKVGPNPSSDQLAEFATKALRLVPPEELKRLRAENEKLRHER